MVLLYLPKFNMFPGYFLYTSFFVFIVFLIWRKCLSQEVKISLDMGIITISKIQWELNIFDAVAPKLFTLKLSNVSVKLTSIGSLSSPSNRVWAFVRPLLLAALFRFVEIRVCSFYGQMRSAFFKSMGNEDIFSAWVRFHEGSFFSSKALSLIEATIECVTSNIGFVTVSNGNTFYWSLDTRAKLIRFHHPEQSKHLLSVSRFYNFLTKDVDKLRIGTDINRIVVNYSSMKVDSETVPSAKVELYDLELCDTIDKQNFRCPSLSFSLKAASELILKCKSEKMSATSKDFDVRASDIEFNGDEVKIRSVYAVVKKVGVTVKQTRCGVDFANNRIWWKCGDYEMDNAFIQAAVFVFASDIVNLLRNHYLHLDNDEAELAHNIRRKYKEISEQVHSLMLHQH